jgi:CheY-like chemotaxis protein
LTAGRRILIVDDEEDACLTLAEILASLGHEVKTAHDGQRALVLAGEFRPEVVLLDIGLPGLDGYEVARRLREQPAMGGALLIALTGYTRENDRKNAERAGFDQHLAKPIKIAALTAFLASR